jgi:hypothetical protein
MVDDLRILYTFFFFDSHTIPGDLCIQGCFLGQTLSKTATGYAIMTVLRLSLLEAFP